MEEIPKKMKCFGYRGEKSEGNTQRDEIFWVQREKKGKKYPTGEITMGMRRKKCGLTIISRRSHRESPMEWMLTLENK